MGASDILTEKERMAIAFYMGDSRVVEDGPYKGGPKAYNTINALLHPGTANEEDKAKEGRVIRLEGVEHLKSYLELILDIFSAMEKYRKSRPTETGCDGSFMRRGWRIDRLTSFERFRADSGRVAGFFSTCKQGWLPQYAHGKAGIVLLEVLWDEKVPFLDFGDVFGNKYAKPEEAEVLLPFEMKMKKIKELAMTPREKALFTDIHGQAPLGKWRIHMTMEALPEIGQDRLRNWYDTVTDKAVVSIIMKCMEKLSAGEVLGEDEKNLYGIWKIMLQQYVTGQCALIRKRIICS